MVLAKCFEPPDLIEASLGGVVTSEDQRRVVEFTRAAIRTSGSVRVLLTLVDFAGWLAGSREHPGDWPGLAALAPARTRSARHGAMLLPFRGLLAAIRDAEAQR